MKQLIVTLLGLSLASSGWAAPVVSATVPVDSTTLTLEKACQLALQNHPQVQAADYGTAAAKAEVGVQQASFLPQLNGNVVGAYAGDNGTRLAATGGLNNSSVYSRASAGVSLSQLITDFGRTSALVDVAKFRLNQAHSQAALARASVVMNVVQAYYGVLRAQALLRVANETLKSRKTFLDQISALHGVQMKSDLDLNLAKQEVADANLLILRAQSNVQDAQATLTAALGSNAPGSYQPVDVGTVAAPPADVETLLNLAVNNNPQLAAYAARQQAYHAQARADARAGLPTITALGYAGLTPVRDDNQPIDPSYAAAGVNLSIPLYTGNRITSQARESEMAAKAADAELRDQQNALVRDVHLAYDNTATAYKNIAVTKEFATNANEVLSLTQARYGIGKSSIVDLNQSQLAATQAQIGAADAVYAYLVQLAALSYTLGDTAEGMLHSSVAKVQETVQPDANSK